MPKVNFTRTEYAELKPRWELVRDCVSGAKAVKKAGDKYLPRPNPEDKSAENKKRYQDYLTRAVFYNVTGRTLRGLVGQVFMTDATINLGARSALMEQDVDGGGVTLLQQARKAVSYGFSYGRAGLLADYPKVEGATTQADLDAGNIRPMLQLYAPWDVINWRVELVGGKRKLTLVVISESETAEDDGFEQKNEDYFRVLRLEDGVYHSQIWYWDTAVNDFVMEEDIVPQRSNGQPWNEIPFTFIGAENNDPSPDLPPLYDLAELNIAHFRNSADYEESCYIVGQPTPYFAGLTEQWVKNVLKGSVALGARAAVPLPEGGSAGLLQAQANSMPKEAMEAKEAQMLALGAKLVKDGQVQRTATEAEMENSSSNSVLSAVSANVSSAYTTALKWAAEFVGDEYSAEDYGLKLPTKFSIQVLPAADLQAIIAAWQGGAIAYSEMRAQLREGGRATLSDEEAKAELDAELPDVTSLPGKPGAVEDPEADPTKQDKQTPDNKVP